MPTLSLSSQLAQVAYQAYLAARIELERQEAIYNDMQDSLDTDGSLFNESTRAEYRERMADRLVIVERARATQDQRVLEVNQQLARERAEEELAAESAALQRATERKAFRDGLETAVRLCNCNRCMKMKADNANARREIIDVSGKECPICLDPLENGTKVCMISCGGNHVVCEDCNNRQEDATETNLPLCPECRGPADVLIVGTAMNYYTGRSDCPIPV